MTGKSLSALRAEFPLLQTCTYLNSNSTGAFPRGMEAVLQRYSRTLQEWRDEVWEGWWADWHAYADAVARFIGGPPGSVVTDGNLTTLMGRLATCFDFQGERRRVVMTSLEFPTVPFLWSGFGRYGAEPVVVPSEGGRVNEEQLCAAIDERTRVVSLCHASFATGALIDLTPVVRRAHAVGAQVVVDAYQSVGAVPIDVQALGVDFLLGGAHKWMCGSVESAFLYIRPELLPSLRPAATGWMAAENPLTFEPARDWAPSARRLASGTPAVLPSQLSQVGLDLLNAAGIQTIREHSLRCTARVMARADEAGLPVVTPRADAQRGGVVTMRFAGDAQVARRLVAGGFVCSYRGGLRVAPHFYNTLDEVDRFMDQLVAEARKEAA
ncbi:aminotransferase class V-fold PLP-dependent enzyme [Stigmatella aurantiaca]|uniref:Aminotransferase, class V superfamily n=2 Tax=Stigmatella aurantiaca (strain DW4/3-1) TaxID=378806 RepID=E3FH98_STIAD|nr:aminotransferase class V-fold PLP-dependent enzyme [Stigmatella aurantiaca]ADO75314.1 Aminotransferase, class V superfamily [Stigmatella aurantiaca DW4/3-1]